MCGSEDEDENKVFIASRVSINIETKNFMAKFILGKKIGMSQMFNENGKLIPVTLVSAGPCEVLQVKTIEKDGYAALQIGFEKIEKEKKIKKTMKGKPFRFLKEVEDGDAKVGELISVSVFKAGDKVKISGVSKSKGFQGAVKRHGFHGRNATHGVKHEHRTLGSIGATFPQRVIKGKKMPGRMGFERVTVKNLEIVKVEEGQNLLAVKGAIPGRIGALLEIRGQTGQ